MFESKRRIARGRHNRRKSGYWNESESKKHFTCIIYREFSNVVSIHSGIYDLLTRTIR